jgi:hypothetical protein
VDVSIQDERGARGRGPGRRLLVIGVAMFVVGLVALVVLVPGMYGDPSAVAPTETTLQQVTALIAALASLSGPIVAVTGLVQVLRARRNPPAPAAPATSRTKKKPKKD